MTSTDPRLLLGPGFLGAWRRPVGLVERHVMGFEAVRAANPPDTFALLADMATRIPPGGVLTGYVGYEAVMALDPSGELSRLFVPPTPFDGKAMPLVWAGLFGGHDAAAPPPAEPVEAPTATEHDADVQRRDYEGAVARTIEAILAGDLFQANLSRPLSATWTDAPDADLLFGRLCAGTDAPYAAMIDLAEGAVLSASPELFLSVEEGTITAEPIKGTRPRGDTPEEDARLAADLEASEKDRAENVMIADLMRNDLSLVAEDGSVREDKVCALRTLPRVHHLYSRITATLRDGLGPFDALRAAFPCGSITGAPKRAAIRRIAAIEGGQAIGGRGPYCGAVFAVTAERAVFSVPIRTGVLTRGKGGRARLDVRVGGGVTAMSDPAGEWAETRDKAYPYTLMTGLRP